jgi:OOP family OmpA-OmpF porin
VAKTAIETYAKSLFGHEAVYVQTRLDENLPDGWPIRVLGGLEALAELHHGILVVKPEEIEVRGISDTDTAAGEISRILAVRVGAREVFKIKVEVDEKLVKKNKPVTPKSCEADINSILMDYKIQFDPGKVVIKGGSKSVVTAIADVLRTCPKVKFEIQGHTDSSGSEELNQNLSQSRAEAVLSALLTRRILTSGLKAKGYGSAEPIADNGTEQGREINRRIVFKLTSTLLEASPTTGNPADQGSQTMNANDIKRKP